MDKAKIKGWLTLNNPHAEALAIKLGFVKGSQDYTRFIILGRSRTGSNYLRGFLKNHPQIISLGEIFREPDRIEFDSPYFPDDGDYINQYKNKPSEFMQNVVFRKFKTEIKAVGFKLFYYHAAEPPFHQIWDTIQTDRDIHILHIKRNNMLETHISRIKADQSNSWVNVTGEKERQRSVFVDPLKCQQDFETTQRWEEEADERFKYHPILQISYENLAENTSSVIAEVQQFLSVDAHKLEPKTYKQSELSLAKSISNYHELKAHFANTRWEIFFVE